MAQFTQDKIIITNAGITQLYSQGQLPDIIYVAIDNAGATLAANVDIGSTFTPPAGFTVQVFVNASTALDLNGYDFYLFGSLISADQLKGQVYFTLTSNGVDWSAPYIGVALYDVPGAEKTLSGRFLVDSSVALTALEPPLAAQFLIGDALGQGSWATMSKDATIDDTGALTISAGAIDNSKVSASAAIALSKLAALTASKPVVTNGSGVLTTASQITAAQGGTGQDTSSSTGFAKVSSGTWSVGSIAVDRDLNVSFEAGETGDFKIKMGFDGTLTDIYAFATKVIAGTDNGTIVPKNNAGTTMTSGTITFTASDARGTAYTSSPSANNTFVAGDILTFTTAKTTSGGKVHLSLKFTRNS